MGCVECEASGGWWVHLRRCAACGHIGCCDSSPSQHARAHAGGSGHPVIQSFEPGETWLRTTAASSTPRVRRSQIRSTGSSRRCRGRRTGSPTTGSSTSTDQAAVARPGAPTRPLSRLLVLVMAAATGLAVANNYYAQPLLATISGDLHLSGGVAGLIVTVSQIGYAAGLVFLLPLGDLLDAAASSC